MLIKTTALFPMRAHQTKQEANISEKKVALIIGKHDTSLSKTSPWTGTQGQKNKIVADFSFPTTSLPLLSIDKLKIKLSWLQLNSPDSEFMLMQLQPFCHKRHIHASEGEDRTFWLVNLVSMVSWERLQGIRVIRHITWKYQDSKAEAAGSKIFSGF